jgi:hypothetical protein
VYLATPSGFAGSRRDRSMDLWRFGVDVDGDGRDDIVVSWSTPEARSAEIASTSVGATP